MEKNKNTKTRLSDVLKKHWLKLFGLSLIILLIILFSFRKEIKENKITKAKIEMFKAIQEGDKDRMKEIIDSL